jgi:heme/copper-type cytochrome/quinol oxidase subunit 4
VARGTGLPAGRSRSAARTSGATVSIFDLIFVFVLLAAIVVGLIWVDT